MRLAMMARILVIWTSSPGCGCGAAGLAGAGGVGAAAAGFGADGCTAFEMAENVLLGDAAGSASGRDGGEIDVVFFGDLADERGGALAFDGGGWCGGWGSCCRGCGLCRGRCRSRCGCGGLRRCGGSANDGDNGVDGDGRAFLNFDFSEGAGDGRRDFCVDFVRGNFKDRLVAGDGVADFFEPLGDRALGDGLTHLRHHDFGAGAGFSRSGGSRCCGSRLFWRGGCSGNRLRLLRSGGGRSAFFVDGANDGVDADSGAFLHLDFAERAGCGRGNFSVHLIGGDLKEGFIASDGVAGLLKPLGEGAFRD